MKEKKREKLVETEETDENQEISPDPPDKQIDIEVEGTGQKRKLIISLAWPALAENVLSSLASMVDMIMVGWLGTYAIGAIGLVLQPKFIMFTAFIAMNIGTTTLVAQNKGAGYRDRANTVLAQSLLLTVALTAAICTILLVFAEPLIRLIAGSEISEKTISEALIYYKIQIYGFPSMALTFTINAALRGAGNTKATFYNNTAANLVNVLFNYLLISGNLGFPRMEVAGASLATVIGQCVALVMAIYVISNGKQYLRLILKKLKKIDFSMMKRILNIGIPSMIDQVIMRIGALWFTTIVTALGDISYSAHMVAFNIYSLSFTTGTALGTAATTLVGQSIGRKRIDLSKVYVRMTQNLGLIVSGAITIIMLFFGRQISGLYSDDLTIIALATDMLKIIALTNPVTNARLVYVSALRGAGDVRLVVVVTFIGMIMVRPLAGYLFVNVLGLGLYGVWLALTTDFVSNFILIMLRYKRGKWTQIAVL